MSQHLSQENIFLNLIYRICNSTSAFFRKEILSCQSSSVDPTFLCCPFVFAVKYVEIKNEMSVLEKNALIPICALPAREQLRQLSLEKTLLRVP